MGLTSDVRAIQKLMGKMNRAKEALDTEQAPHRCQELATEIARYIAKFDAIVEAEPRLHALREEDWYTVDLAFVRQRLAEILAESDTDEGAAA